MPVPLYSPPVRNPPGLTRLQTLDMSGYGGYFPSQYAAPGSDRQRALRGVIAGGTFSGDGKKRRSAKKIGGVKKKRVVRRTGGVLMPNISFPLGGGIMVPSASILGGTFSGDGKKRRRKKRGGVSGLSGVSEASVLRDLVRMGEGVKRRRAPRRKTGGVSEAQVIRDLVQMGVGAKRRRAPRRRVGGLPILPVATGLSMLKPANMIRNSSIYNKLPGFLKSAVSVVADMGFGEEMGGARRRRKKKRL